MRPAERDRIIDGSPLPSMLWFSLSQSIAAGTTDTQYSVTYGIPSASSAPSDGTAVFGLSDDFTAATATLALAQFVGQPSALSSASIVFWPSAFRVYGIDKQPTLTIFTLDGTPAYTTPATNDQALSLMIRNYLVTSDLVVDWIRSRSVTYPDPSVILGPEQTL